MTMTKKIKRRTPEERAAQEANQRELLRRIALAKAELETARQKSA